MAAFVEYVNHFKLWGMMTMDQKHYRLKRQIAIKIGQHQLNFPEGTLVERGNGPEPDGGTMILLPTANYPIAVDSRDLEEVEINPVYDPHKWTGPKPTPIPNATAEPARHWVRLLKTFNHDLKYGDILEVNEERDDSWRLNIGTHGRIIVQKQYCDEVSGPEVDKIPLYVRLLKTINGEFLAGSIAKIVERFENGGPYYYRLVGRNGGQTTTLVIDVTAHWPELGTNPWEQPKPKTLAEDTAEWIQQRTAKDHPHNKAVELPVAESCGVCKHYKPMVDTAAGFCHRYPPRSTCSNNNIYEQYSYWPGVGKAEWCGEFVRNPIHDF